MKYNQCRFCNEHTSLQNVQMEHLFKKYFNAFNFYFAKPISEILANIPADHVILFKDLLFYNDDYEYLTKYYDQRQQLSKLVKTNKIPMPNMVIVTAHKIMEKRIAKINKMHDKQQTAKIPASQDRQMIPDRIFHDSFQQSNQSSFQNQQSISWETDSYNIYQNDSHFSIQKTIVFTLPKPLICDKSNEKLYNCPNDKELDQMFTQINQFTSNLLKRIKTSLHKPKLDKKTNQINIPKLKIPQPKETNKQNNFNFQALLSQYDKILERRKYGATTDRNYMKPKIEIKIQQIMEESKKRPKESPRVYFNQGGFPNAVTKKTSQLPSPCSTYGKNNRVSTCSPSMLLKSISKESIEKSLVNARRKEIIMNLNKLIREQERDLGYLTHR